MIEMKVFLRTSVFAAVAALMVSCGDGLDAGSCIDSAEESIELKESPLLGELPSLSDQWREAETVARKKADRLYDEYRKQYRNDEIDRETLNDKLSELYERKDEALKELEEYYYPKMTEIAEELKGKEVPVKFDNAVFKSAKVTFLSTYRPSTWWKKQCARYEMASLRYTRPGQMMRIGGCACSMTRV